MSTKRHKNKIEIIERKLGREKSLGLYWDNKKIEIDPRQSPREYLNSVIHEGIHHVFKEKKEKEVIRATSFLTRLLWNLNYRKVNQ
jgi:hypothetical protein